MRIGRGSDDPGGRGARVRGRVRREISRNYFAKAANGTVCYFGEAVDIYDETGQRIISNEGQWRADDAGNGPGIIMPASPQPGMKYQNENAPGIALDAATVIGVGPVPVLGETVSRAIRVREFNPLEGEKGYKVFAFGFGLVVDGPVVLIGYSP